MCVLYVLGSHGLFIIHGWETQKERGNEPVKKDVTPEPNDNAVAWRNFFNANYKALRAAEKGLTEKEATDKLKVQYKGFTDEEKSEWRSYDPNPNPAKKAITLTSNPVILPNYYSDSEGRKSSDNFVVFDRELEEDAAAAETRKKAECSQAVEESPLKSPVRSKTNVVGLSDENVVDSSKWHLSGIKAKPSSNQKKTQSENVPLIEDDFNDKAYEQFIESGKNFTLITIESDMCLRNFESLKWIGGAWHRCGPLREVEGFIIDYFSILMNKYERDSRLPDQPRVRYMPTRISMKNAFCSKKLSVRLIVKRIAKDREWSKVFYEDNLEKCVKDVCAGVDSRRCTTLLSTLDLLFEENRSKNVTFRWISRIDRKDRGLPQQDNDRDCGVYVMKYMEDVANEEEVVDEVYHCLVISEFFVFVSVLWHSFTRLRHVWKSLRGIITDEQNEIRTKVVEDRRAAKAALCIILGPLHSPSKSPPILGSDSEVSQCKHVSTRQEPPLGSV
ncbi:hypothetical protein F8388_024982 [Cannabis sativa]|uniref:Ubiquitin-like protease family profile domain-containing protein n=1 Tax=Cannabis sativa TaxID=3483 RepID=A0A7J6G3C5_CANSA|nr:hypothetical protein F8388_024982 [Cannabis sativa]